jgi:3-phenylpropionate/trans-cinnamate dioxygenase ferredoxin reductase subunit
LAARAVDYLLVGGGMGSAHCAAELRKRGADGSVLLVGREPDPPYERPPLSKEYLRGESGRADAYVHPPEWYRENEVELLTGTSVTSLDAGSRTATLQTKEEVRFGQALIATGARVNILHHLEGARLEGIHYLRTMGNSGAIRDDAGEGGHVVLIGGSYIGSEVAASLTARGVRCTMVMLEEVALSRAFGDEVGRRFHDVLASHGIEILGGEELESFVGAGVHPDTALAERAGLEVENGIVCDRRLESSVEGIYAAGDCCSYDSVIHGRRLRVEHWDVAFQQGRYAGRAMTGEEAPYDEVPYFFSDLADWTSLEYVGPASKWDEVVWRGDADGGEFTAFYLAGGRVVAALTAGRSEDLTHARRLLADGVDVTHLKEALGDTESDLEEIGSG